MIVFAVVERYLSADIDQFSLQDSPGPRRD